MSEPDCPHCGTPVLVPDDPEVNGIENAICITPGCAGKYSPPFAPPITERIY